MPPYYNSSLSISLSHSLTSSLSFSLSLSPSLILSPLLSISQNELHYHDIIKLVQTDPSKDESGDKGVSTNC